MMPILSVETILSAMMCLCSTNHSSFNEVNSMQADQVNYSHPNQHVMLVKSENILNIEEKLSYLTVKFAEFQRQKISIMSALERIQGEVTSLKTSVSACPREATDSPNQIINLRIPTYPYPFEVLCAGKQYFGGVGWLIIQQRYDGTENFFRSWQEYRHGFGVLNAEFFIGLEKLHALTADKPQELLILLEDFEGDRRFAKYDNFEIGNESEGFALKALGTYSGNAGDSLQQHVSQKFTTYDRDNDDASRNCAVDYTGAWWYSKCHISNLNGQYLTAAISVEKHGMGISWKTFRGLDYSLKSVKMMIRPRI